MTAPKKPFFGKERRPNGRRHIYIFGIKIFSYQRKHCAPSAPVNFISGTEYDRIYFPHYYPNLKIYDKKPDIYNAAGQKMDVFFIRDRHFSHEPYGSAELPTKFLWDRFNIGLDTHFYTGGSMFELMGAPKRRFALFTEPEIITPGHYAALLDNRGHAARFEKILSCNEKILDTFPNAVFFPHSAGLWHSGGGKEKTKNISIVSSNKTMCDLHKLRLSLARECKARGLADAFGTFDGGPFCETADYLDHYRYCIMIENEISKYYFSERLTSCFAAKTVPIYIGCPDIGKWFNTDGIIQISPADADNIEKILKICSESDYESRMPAILDNYNRGQEYKNIWDKMYIEIIAETGHK